MHERLFGSSNPAASGSFVFICCMMSTTSDLALLRRKLAAADYSPDAYVKEIATRCVGGHELHLQRKNIQVLYHV